MTFATIQNAFTGGEISPSLFGRTDLAKWRDGASTARNFFINYRGGASSRAGLKYILQCRQAGDGPPPRLIPFQFSINQGFALEFGDNTIINAVTGAADNGGTLIRLAITSTRGIFSGSSMIVSGVVGTTEANGTWVVTVIDGTHVDLVGSTFSNPYVSGGTTSDSSGYMRVISNGAYVIEDSKAITGVTEASPGIVHIAGHGYSVSDWIFIEDILGVTSSNAVSGLNGLSWIVDTVVDANHVTLTDLFGNVFNGSMFLPYISGGTASRIYTIPAPYAAVDLPYLKYTQDQNTMSFACVNQETGSDYLPYDLQRVTSTNWVFTAVSFASSIAAPTGLSALAHNSDTVDTYYSYVVTAVDSTTGEESIASAIATVQNNDIAILAGSNELSWTPVGGASSYNVYASTPQFGATTPAGVLYGYIGTSIGAAFIDTNIQADFTKVPPVHKDPFPSHGNYPGVVAYFQQRRVYGYTLNNPDTYYMSQPGAFTNFDSSIPTSDSDAITGAPWAQQINGIQFMQPMTNGLMILTGNGAWYLTGGNNAAITPSDQTATAQAYNGCHFSVQPLVINYDILYVQSKGSIVRDLSYNFFSNVWTGTDKTVLSSHLFNYHQINRWTYAEEPYKVVWGIRDDGIMLSLTYLKEQDVYAWARHDTNGFFIDVCSVTEPPVDAVYNVTQRFINNQWVYYSERMDNRNWQNAEDAFCVDAGLSYPMSFPAATLIPEFAEGLETIFDVNIISGGSGYTAPVVTALDQTGSGSGATFSATVMGGVITAIAVLTEGTGYVLGQTQIIVTDTTGSGAIVQPIIENNVRFTASEAIFSLDNLGDVIRLGNSNSTPLTTGVTNDGGGKAIITIYSTPTEVFANIIEPITATIPNNPGNKPVPALAGQWSLSTPTSVVGALNHLEGQEVAILADGSVVANQVVTNGAVTLPQAYSAITVGLPYTCQLQTLYLEPPGEQTVQGKRKNVYNATVRVELSRGLQVGTNQPDQSTQPNYAAVPWTDMKEIKQRNALVTAGSAVPLFTGDEYINVPADWDVHGQIAVQQVYPLPANVLAIVADYQIGDTPG